MRSEPLTDSDAEGAEDSSSEETPSESQEEDQDSSFTHEQCHAQAFRPMLVTRVDIHLQYYVVGGCACVPMNER